MNSEQKSGGGQRRTPMRLPSYDYAAGGVYFVTIVTQGKRCLFGRIESDEMQLSAAGEMLREEWEGLPERFPSVGLDQFVVMPNHIHGLVVIGSSGEAPTRGGRHDGVGDGPRRGDCTPDRAATRAAPTLSDVVGAFKSVTTVEYIRGVKSLGWPAFEGRLWQRNYYDHVVRNERDLDRIRQYILENPLKWALDSENPGNSL